MVSVVFGRWSRREGGGAADQGRKAAKSVLQAATGKIVYISLLDCRKIERQTKDNKILFD